jgi:hypothetical protein
MKSNRYRHLLIYSSICVFLIALLAGGFALAGREEATINTAAADLQVKRSANPYNKQLVDSGVRTLRTGDLVVRTGADITSYIFSQLNHEDKTYSHCGIVIIENGYPFIYHSIGGEDNPDQVLRRDSASFWFSPANNLGFGVVRYTISNHQVDAITSVTRQIYKEKRKFDMDFDLNTDDRLYCAEFAYKAINMALKDPQYIKPITLLGYTFVGIDNLFLNKHAQLICQLRFK